MRHIESTLHNDPGGHQSASGSSTRPLVLTAFCTLALLVMLYRAGVAIWTAPSLGETRLVYILLHKAVVIAAIVGVLRLKRWGAYLYVFTYVVSTVLYFIWPPAQRVPTAVVLASGVLGLSIFAAVTIPFWDRFSGAETDAERRSD